MGPPTSGSPSESINQGVTTQERSMAEVIVTLTGRAIRIGYPIEGKYLAAIENGAEIGAVQKSTRKAFTPERIPIYETWWRRIYRQVTSGEAGKNFRINSQTIPASQSSWVKYPPSS
jgi:hypothetical protein